MLLPCSKVLLHVTGACKAQEVPSGRYVSSPSPERSMIFCWKSRLFSVKACVMQYHSHQARMLADAAAQHRKGSPERPCLIDQPHDMP